MTIKKFQGTTWTCNGCGREVEAQGQLIDNLELPSWWYELKYRESTVPNPWKTFHFCSRKCLSRWAMAGVVVTDEYGREFTWDGSVFKVEKKEVL